MTTPVFCSSTGSNTAPYNTWATAATTFATAIGQASSAGDIVAVDVTNPPADVTASTTWTFLNRIFVIGSTNSGAATITPTPMGETAWLGSATGAYQLIMAGSYNVYFYGITIRNGGAANAGVYLNYTQGGSFVFESGLLWLGTAYPSALFIGANGKSYTRFINSNYKFGHTGQIVQMAGLIESDGGAVLATGSIPTSFLRPYSASTAISFYGFDASALGSGNLVNCASAYSEAVVRFIQPKLGTGYVARVPYATPMMGSGELYIHDGSSGSTQGIFGYYNDFGSVVSNTGVYETASPAAQSWQINTTANCSFGTPFVTPWIDQWNTTLTSINPGIEILRIDSTSAYTNKDVWGEFTAKVTTGTTDSTLYSSRQALVDWAAGTAGTAIPTGTGTANWTGAGATPWSGKVSAGSLTPAYAGSLLGRIAVAAPSATIYANPQVG